jgi:quinol monooxygenase YgiN
MKYVLGRMTIAPGKRDQFIGAARAYLARTRDQARCAFFARSIGRIEPDVALPMAAFADEAARPVHSKTPHQAWMRAHRRKFVTIGEFQKLDADRTVRDTMDNRGQPPPDA